MRSTLHLLGTVLSVVLSVAAHAINVTVNVMSNDHCGYGDGRLSAEPTGGVPPYTYEWSNGGTQQAIWNLFAGTYSVTVTDANMDQATANGTVLLVDHTDQFAAGLTGDAYCPDGGMAIPFVRWSPWWNGGSFGPEPWTFNGLPVTQDPWSGGEPFYNVPIGGQPGQWVAMQFQDANGCTGDLQAQAGYPVEWPVTSILQINGTCTGGSTGSVQVAYTAEGHGYAVSTEVRNMQDQVVLMGGFNWHGNAPAVELFQGLPAGQLRLIQRLTMAAGSLYYDWCSEETIITIPDLGVDCGNVSGTVYMDYDQNCIMGPAGMETRVPEALLEFMPGPVYATANSAGQYSIDLPTGNYTVQHLAANVAQHCPEPSAPVIVSGVETLNIADTSLVPLDVQVMMASGPARPGFQLSYTINAHNLTPAASGATSTVMTFDPAITFLSATPAQSTIVGNTITWNQASLGAFAERSIQVRFQVPSDEGLIGTILNSTVTVSTANTDAVPANNSVGHAVTVTGSYDPNDKVGNTSSRSNAEFYLIDEDEYIDYVIRFQNTGTDTAFTVVITDTLPATLDPASIVWGASSHTCMRSLLGQGIVKFIFPNILLPDSNANEAASHGYVSFRIRPHQPLLPGTVFENVANIYFDFNSPVITEPSVLTAEFNTGVEGRTRNTGVSIYPNPTDRSATVVLDDGGMRRVELYGLDGILVRTWSANGHTSTIDLSDIAAGGYVLRVIDQDERARMLPLLRR